MACAANICIILTETEKEQTSFCHSFYNQQKVWFIKLTREKANGNE